MLVPLREAALAGLLRRHLFVPVVVSGASLAFAASCVAAAIAVEVPPKSLRQAAVAESGGMRLPIIVPLFSFGCAYPLRSSS